MDFITILLWIIIGGIAGWIASMIMGKNAQMGKIANIIAGIVGAVLVAFISSLFGVSMKLGSGNWIITLIAAVVGACVVIWVVSLVMGRRGGRTGGRTRV